MAQFLARIVPCVSKSVVLYVAIYALYITAASVGVSHTFGNRTTDPIMAANQTDTVLRYNNLDASLKELNKSCRLPVSEEVKSVFNGGVTQKQQEILSTLDFEFRSKNLTYVRCPACSSDTLQLKPDNRACSIKTKSPDDGYILPMQAPPSQPLHILSLQHKAYHQDILVTQDRRHFSIFPFERD